MSYKITITETKYVKKLAGKEWKEIGTREVARDEAFSRSSSESKTRIESVMGYTPEIERVVESTTEILSQTVEELDVAAVIKAINKL